MPGRQNGFRISGRRSTIVNGDAAPAGGVDLNERWALQKTGVGELDNPEVAHTLTISRLLQKKFGQGAC